MHYVYGYKKRDSATSKEDVFKQPSSKPISNALKLMWARPMCPAEQPTLAWPFLRTGNDCRRL